MYHIITLNVMLEDRKRKLFKLKERKFISSRQIGL